MIKGKVQKILKRINIIIDRRLPILMQRSGFLSSCYYTFFSKAFYREHQSVLAGKVQHIYEEKNYFLLVRNTHRLEKGLLMKPRRADFGNEYIKETVLTFVKICKNTILDHDKKQLIWCH